MISSNLPIFGIVSYKYLTYQCKWTCKNIQNYHCLDAKGLFWDLQLSQLHLLWFYLQSLKTWLTLVLNLSNQKHKRKTLL